jgi:hypothetical protein
MSLNTDTEYDKRLRSRLEPQPAMVNRLIQAALAKAARRRGTRWVLYRLALALAAATFLVLLFAHFQSPDSGSPNRPRSDSLGDVVLLQASTGESWILSTDKSALSLPPGMGLVILEGKSK